MALGRGFTLVELMVSIFIGGLLLGGAFELNMAFNRQTIRQQHVVDMQQTLRITRQVIERVVRGAGAGLQDTSLSANTCGGAPNLYYPFQFSNSNTFSDPKNTFDSTPSDSDQDADWLRVVNVGAGTNASSDDGSKLCVASTSGFVVGDIVAIINTDPSRPQSCLRSLTSLGTACPGNAPSLSHASASSCLNQPPIGDPCLSNMTWPAPIRRITGNTTQFRIDTSDASTPRLMVSYTDITRAPQWQVLAENLEDLQVAMVMADGRVCGNAGNSVDDPALCSPPQLRSVRFTISARSSVPIPGFPPGSRGGSEDLPASSVSDGFLRRSVTTLVQLRNQP